MDILDPVIAIINFIVGILNGILDFIEAIFSPVIDLINRWNNLFGGGE